MFLKYVLYRLADLFAGGGTDAENSHDGGRRGEVDHEYGDGRSGIPHETGGQRDGLRTKVD